MAKTVVNPHWIVEMIRPADNARIMFGPFSSEEGADSFKAKAERNLTVLADRWEIGVQVINPTSFLKHMKEVPGSSNPRSART